MRLKYNTFGDYVLGTRIGKGQQRPSRTQGTVTWENGETMNNLMTCVKFKSYLITQSTAKETWQRVASINSCDCLSISIDSFSFVTTTATLWLSLDHC